MNDYSVLRKSIKVEPKDEEYRCVRLQNPHLVQAAREGLSDYYSENPRNINFMFQDGSLVNNGSLRIFSPFLSRLLGPSSPVSYQELCPTVIISECSSATFSHLCDLLHYGTSIFSLEEFDNKIRLLDDISSLANTLGIEFKITDTFITDCKVEETVENTFEAISDTEDFSSGEDGDVIDKRVPTLPHLNETPEEPKRGKKSAIKERLGKKLSARNSPYQVSSRLDDQLINVTRARARYFVIKSYSEEDVDESILNGVWCSTEHGNRRLNKAF